MFDESELPCIPFEGQWRWKFKRDWATGSWYIHLEKKIGFLWFSLTKEYIVSNVPAEARLCIRNLSRKHMKFPANPIPGRRCDC